MPTLSDNPIESDSSLSNQSDLSPSPDNPSQPPETAPVIPPPPPPPSSTQHITGVIEKQILEIRDDISTLSKHFDTKIMYDESKERTIELLHKSMQDYKEDLVLKILRPLVNELVNLYNDLAKQELSELQAPMDDLEKILEQHGFVMFENPLPTFDRETQVARKSVQTPDPTLDLRIARRILRGVRYGDRVFRQESVEVYRFTPSATDA